MPSATEIAQKATGGRKQAQHTLPPIKYRKAIREHVWLRIVLGGLAGAGKTQTAIELAQGLGDNPVLLDTEGGSGELYASTYNYDYAAINPPYTPELFVHHIDSAITAGYDVIILDSISHEWDGVLEIADSAPQSVYGGWGIATPRHKKFIDAILHKPIHIIATCRMKTGYELVKNWKGKDTPQKKPELVFVQKEGIEYEFTVGFRLITDGLAVPLKDRTSMFRGQPSIQLTKQVGVQLRKWANSGADHTNEFAALTDKLKSSGTLKELKQFFSEGYNQIAQWGNKNTYIETFTQQKDELKELLTNQESNDG